MTTWLLLISFGLLAVGHKSSKAATPAKKKSTGGVARTKWLSDGSAEEWVRQFSSEVAEAASDFGLPPESTAQFVTAHAALESGWGRSLMTQRAKNAFGVKATKSWTGETYTTKVEEYREDGKTKYKTTATFRVYPSYEASIRDYLRLVTEASRYKTAANSLRNADENYMEELARGGYLRKNPAETGRQWKNALSRVRRVLAGGKVANV